MFTRRDLVEWASVALVVVCGMLAGHYVSVGMTPVQWVGAAMAVAGSIAIAVAVRVWPASAKQD